MHTHYKGTGKVHSFRGLLADGAQRRIRIQGPTGEIAWRITKFKGFPHKPGVGDFESTLMIWREKQSSVSTITATTTFDNAELLGAYFDHGFTSGASTSSTINEVVFDNSLFSRNIYVTHTNTTGSGSYNYYIELEEVKVSAAGMAQLAVAAARRTL